ncbi:hypothetical protein LCGC14_0823580 [marine sediment metagenome]|uniref:Uncharacterized protein n=1 Tax=marine sediment metagenome TaxID=412755 RepID=A0A0F9PI30_9ZZZZ
MIIELTWYEPDGGRKYESPLGGEIEAMEYYRIDCVECQYTKIRMKPEDVEAKDAYAGWIEKRFGMPRDRVSLLPSLADTTAPLPVWFEAIFVQYRCSGDAKSKALLGIGYELQLYGAEQRPSRLVAQMGPAAVQVEEEYP